MHPVRLTSPALQRQLMQFQTSELLQRTPVSKSIKDVLEKKIKIKFYPLNREQYLSSGPTEKELAEYCIK